ncbi:hypothetical protein B0H19DRAFT_1072085 [Mycena capillaripes]|nr:hypothetical protein B0H19DRAFT_1072085 [Mycena capillaripes]
MRFKAKRSAVAREKFGGQEKTGTFVYSIYPTKRHVSERNRETMRNSGMVSANKRRNNCEIGIKGADESKTRGGLGPVKALGVRASDRTRAMKPSKEHGFRQNKVHPWKPDEAIGCPRGKCKLGGHDRNSLGRIRRRPEIRIEGDSAGHGAQFAPRAWSERASSAIEAEEDAFILPKADVGPRVSFTVSSSGNDDATRSEAFKKALKAAREYWANFASSWETTAIGVMHGRRLHGVRRHGEDVKDR